MGELLASVRPRDASAPAGSRWWWHLQLKKPFFGRFMKPWRWPAGVPEAGWERHTVASPSHSRLQALLGSTDVAPARGVVVCAHPMGLAAKGHWLPNGLAAALRPAGFHVVSFDFNGFGESPSTNFDWPADLVAVGRWAQRRFAGLPVHVVGASFGAMHALNALAAGPGYPFERVVAEACPPTLPLFWRAYPLPHAVLQVARLFAPAAERRLRPEAAIAALPTGVRVLLVHSEGDLLTPAWHGDRLQAAAPAGARVERLVLARAGHAQGMTEEPERYWPAVRQFLLSE